MENPLSTDELEKRMRHAGWGMGGLLGKKESLERVISQDAQTLIRLGFSYEKIASLLEELLTLTYKSNLNILPSMFYQQNKPQFSPDNLPDVKFGYLRDHLQIFVFSIRMVQQCPWECHDKDMLGNGTFLILNRKTVEFVTGSNLLAHLIRKHHFFTGLKSPHRIDPETLIRVLEIV
jgi:hypothetical protein